MAEAIRNLVIKVTVDADSKPLEDVGDAADVEAPDRNDVTASG